LFRTCGDPYRHRGDQHSASPSFIPACDIDNSFNNSRFKHILESLTGWQRRGWLEGHWDISAGQLFTTFRRDIHLTPHFDESHALEWFAALD
jgi:hypothetical protein